MATRQRPRSFCSGSEGELKVAARSLPEFLWRIALAKLEAGPLEDLLSQRDDDGDDGERVPDQRAELAAWLRRAGLRAPTKPALAATARARSSFRKWLEAHGTRERKARRRNPELTDLGKTLRRSLPRTAEP